MRIGLEPTVLVPEKSTLHPNLQNSISNSIIWSTAGSEISFKEKKAEIEKLNERLCAESKLPSNLTEGCQIESFGNGEFKPLVEIVEKALNKLPKGSSAIIVIDDRTNIGMNRAVRSTIKCQHCRDLIIVLTIDVALAKLGKKALYHSIYYSSPEQWVKEFMSGQREGEILVVSFELMRGIEHSFIIDTTMFS